MTYVIGKECIGVKSHDCVDVCPVDCIYPNKNKDPQGFANVDQLFINPNECISCGQCVLVCPVEAITHVGNASPEAIKANEDFFK